MIASPEQLPTLSPEAYLEWEEQQSLKYEYLNGEAYAMTGGTLAHNDIAVNLTTAFKNHLRGKGCKVRMADAKVGITEAGPFFYPDILVTCDEGDRQARVLVQHPCLIVEVLSPSTEAFDRGEKFRQYRRLDSLREYVLINAETMGIDCYRLNERNKWELTTYSADEEDSPPPDLVTLQLTSIDFQCPLSLVYEDVAFA